jgi:hypothetical protein
MLAERDLVVARLAASADDPAASELYPAAIAALRDHSSPYHLTEGLLDFAEFLTSTDNASSSGPLIDEAEQIAARLGARPLTTRAKLVRGQLDRPPVRGRAAARPT